MVRLKSTRRMFLSAVALAATGLFSSLPVWAAPPTKVAYTVAVTDTASKTYRVTAKAEGITDGQVSFALPAWSPGWYVLTNAWKNISKVTATDDAGKQLTVAHPDKLTWTVTTNGAKNVTLSYDLLAKDQDPDVVGPGGKPFKDYGFFAPYMDEDHGFVPGPASLVYVVDGKEVPHQVTYKVPQGWQIATGNDPGPEPGSFTAKDYDTLADQPAELGKFKRYDKTIDGVPFSVIIVGNDDESAHRKFVNACWKISEAGIKVFGKAPFPRYLYLFHFLDNFPAMMGLEHLNSTVICMPEDTLGELNLGALSIVAHEYTHAWNVKRIRSAALGPFDYTKEVRTKDLWFLEGVTDYYAPRLIVEAGLAGSDFWRGYIAEQVSELQRNDARKKVTLETASVKAWEGRSEGFGGLSYYNKGLVVGLLLDVEMRRLSSNKVGLDDLIRALLKQSEDTGKGFSDGEIERLASQLTGSDMTGFFERSLRTTNELDYQATLPSAGLKVSTFSFTRPDLGVDVDSLALDGDGIRLGDITAGGPAQKVGLKKGDVIATIDDKPVASAIGPVFQYKKPGDEITLGIVRNGQKQKVLLTLGKHEETVYELGLTDELDANQRAIFGAISGTAPKPTVGTQ